MESCVYRKAAFCSGVEATHLMYQIHQRPQQPVRRVIPNCPHCLQNPQYTSTLGNFELFLLSIANFSSFSTCCLAGLTL